MITVHKFITTDSRDCRLLPDRSVQLVVTSPPYPMIKMWDPLFSEISPEINSSLKSGDSEQAFESMHLELDKTWQEIDRVLIPGGFACINIGDALRTTSDGFQVFSNHSRILRAFAKMGFVSLPLILWRKPTNAPNKFMGSGMLPGGAYVTLEHEYILIFRKKGKRDFTIPDNKKLRKESAIFWEERNNWYRDFWDIKGIGQKLPLNQSRERSAAFPIDLPYRLISMYSIYGDTVLDPFSGIGTTSLACIITGRNSISLDKEKNLHPQWPEKKSLFFTTALKYQEIRAASHENFVQGRIKNGNQCKYSNTIHNFPVMTNQEKEIRLYTTNSIQENSDKSISVNYSTMDYRSVVETSDQLTITQEKISYSIL